MRSNCYKRISISAYHCLALEVMKYFLYLFLFVEFDTATARPTCLVNNTYCAYEPEAPFIAVRLHNSRKILIKCGHDDHELVGCERNCVGNRTGNAFCQCRSRKAYCGH